MNLVFAAVAALTLDAVALVLVWLVGYHYAKRKGEQQSKNAFVAINRALTELPPLDRERAIKASPDKIVGLLKAVAERRQAIAAKAQGDAAARERELRA